VTAEIQQKRNSEEIAWHSSCGDAYTSTIDRNNSSPSQTTCSGDAWNEEVHARLVADFNWNGGKITYRTIFSRWGLSSAEYGRTSINASSQVYSVRQGVRKTSDISPDTWYPKSVSAVRPSNPPSYCPSHFSKCDCVCVSYWAPTSGLARSLWSPWGIMYLTEWQNWVRS